MEQILPQPTGPVLCSGRVVHMTTDSVPLVFGSDDQFRALRSVLTSLHYDEPSICTRTGVQSIFDFRTKAEQREAGIELKDALDALIHLLMDGETMLHDH